MITQLGFTFVPRDEYGTQVVDINLGDKNITVFRANTRHPDVAIEYAIDALAVALRNLLEPEPYDGL